MSLLNDMLNDLKRAPSAERSHVLPTPLTKRHEATHNVNVFAWVNITVVAILLILFVLIGLKLSHALTSKIAPLSSASVVQVQEDVIVKHEVESKIPEQALSITENLTPEHWYDEHLNDALEAIQEGDDPYALDVLSRILIKFPASIDARENLVALYIAHAKFSEANELLDEGLVLKPHNLRLTTMKARLLIEQGKHHEALILLEQFSPNINKSPDYYALLAVIFNALGRTEEAGSLYQTLIEIEPSNGQYYLGLGIALEHKNASQQAIEAYKRAR